MSWQEKIERYRERYKAELGRSQAEQREKEKKEEQRRLERAKEELRLKVEILEKFRIREVLVQIRDEVWKTGEVRQNLPEEDVGFALCTQWPAIVAWEYDPPDSGYRETIRSIRIVKEGLMINVMSRRKTLALHIQSFAPAYFRRFGGWGQNLDVEIDPTGEDAATRIEEVLIHDCFLREKNGTVLERKRKDVFKVTQLLQDGQDHYLFASLPEEFDYLRQIYKEFGKINPKR